MTQSWPFILLSCKWESKSTFSKPISAKGESFFKFFFYQICYQHDCNYISWGHHLSNSTNHSLQWSITRDCKSGAGLFLLRITTVDPNNGQQYLHQCCIQLWNHAWVNALCLRELLSLCLVIRAVVSELWALQGLTNTDCKTVSQSDVQSFQKVHVYCQRYAFLIGLGLS